MIFERIWIQIRKRKLIRYQYLISSETIQLKSYVYYFVCYNLCNDLRIHFHLLSVMTGCRDSNNTTATSDGFFTACACLHNEADSMIIMNNDGKNYTM